MDLFFTIRFLPVFSDVFNKRNVSYDVIVFIAFTALGLVRKTVYVYCKRK